MDVYWGRDDLHEFDPSESIGADGQHPRVPSDLEDVFTKPLTILKSGESHGQQRKRRYCTCNQNGVKE